MLCMMIAIAMSNKKGKVGHMQQHSTLPAAIRKQAPASRRNILRVETSRERGEDKGSILLECKGTHNNKQHNVETRCAF